MAEQNSGHPLEGWIDGEIRKVMIRLILLRKISAKRTYTYEILKELGKFPIVKHFDKAQFKSSIYNAISGLQREGYIKVQDVSGGSPKKYFTLTPKGRRALADARKNFGAAMRRMVRILG
jgi:DNA-binding PadR family transcriptional regulator